MDEISLRQELLKGEDSTRQFKRECTDARKLAAELAAFLNSKGGRIYVGVDDDGSIVGLSSDDIGALNQLVSNACTNNLEPSAGVSSENVATSDGMVVVLAIEEGNDKPYQTSDGYFYVKRGADKRRVTTRAELRRIFQAGGAVYAEALPVTGSTLANLDLDRFGDFYTAKYGRDVPDENNIEQELTACRLMADSRLTVAGALLFAKNAYQLLPEFTIKAVWFKGVDRAGTEFRDSRVLTGTLAQQYEQGMAFCRKWNSRIQTDPSINSPAADEVPDLVFEELLTNALIHRDYFIQDSVKIFIFDDRIEIRSPGRLPNSLTVEQMRHGVRRDRKPVLASFAYDVMQYRGLGSGILRALKAVPGLLIEEADETEEVTVTIPVPRAATDD